MTTTTTNARARTINPTSVASIITLGCIEAAKYPGGSELIANAKRHKEYRRILARAALEGRCDLPLPYAKSITSLNTRVRLANGEAAWAVAIRSGKLEVAMNDGTLALVDVDGVHII